MVSGVAAKRRTERLVSLDAYRGFIMIVLAAHGFGFSHFAQLPTTAPAWNSADYDLWQTIGFHFRHAKWVAVNETFGVAFWDLSDDGGQINMDNTQGCGQWVGDHLNFNNVQLSLCSVGVPEPGMLALTVAGVLTLLAGSRRRLA